MQIAGDDDLIKILVVGPRKGGKSFISNLLGGVVESGRTIGETDDSKYKATVGVRILEAERNVNVGKGMESVQVQLWDCSGDNSREDLWPGLQHEAAGALLVYNPDYKEQEAEADVWFEFMIAGNDYAPVLSRSPLEHTLVIRHRQSSDHKDSRAYAMESGGKLSDPRCVKLSTDSETEMSDLSEAFDSLLRRVLKAQRDAERKGSAKEDKK